MKGKYVVAGIVGVAVLAIASPVLAGPSLSSLIKKEVAKQISAQSAAKKGKRGPAGPAGPAGTAGAPGANGANGTPGANGSTKGGAAFGRITGISTTTDTQYGSPVGASTANAAEGPVSMLLPAGTTVLRDLLVEINTSAGNDAGDMRIFRLMVFGIPAISCKMEGTETFCEDDFSFTIPDATVGLPGAPPSFSMRVETTGTPAGTIARFGYHVEGP